MSLSTVTDLPTDLVERLESVRVDVEDNIERVIQDLEHCNCDQDDQCYNLECREGIHKNMEHYTGYAMRRQMLGMEA